MIEEEQHGNGIPEWVVTFGDMMSLLLTFFIMLVSMSEIKEEERFQAMLESMRRQFGHETSSVTVLPGEVKPRNSNLQTLASLGRSKRMDIMRGGNPVQAVKGENKMVQTIRPGRTSTLGGVVYFEELAHELSDAATARLRQIAHQIAGKPQRIEVRGHASRKPPAEGDHWALAYKRAHAVMKELINSGIDKDRIRVSSAGATEPIDTGIDAESRKRNARAEVLMWDEPIGRSQSI